MVRIRRQHPERVQDLDDKGWEQVGDGYESHYATEEKDERLLVKEGVRRLAKEMKDKTKLVLLLRYGLNDEDREALAKEYGVANDFVSLVKTRWLHRLQKHVREVLREDEAGELVLGDDSEIAFLKPYMKW